jgi:arylsulfatase A-like enzyme/Flp pilus assembly protein TadD
LLNSGLKLLVPLAAAFLLFLAGCSAGGGGAAPPESLLLVTLDTVRADHLGSYGYAAAETPWLDRLAREGVRFEQASATAPLTLPSHASLLSGLLPPHHGLRNNGAGVFPEGTSTLATLLSGAGYRTGAFVGAFVLDRRFGLGRGFEVYDDEIPRDPTAGVVLEAERPGREVVDRALAWLGQDQRPFFLWVHLYDAHAPYVPPSPWRERHPGRPYDGEISSVDEQVGRLLQELEKRGLAGRTAVAVVADHGEGLGEHGELTHGLLLYEPTLRVPFLLRSPDLPAGTVIRTPVSLVDLAPTLAGLLGKSLPAPSAPAGRPLDGRDLSASLRKGEEPAPADVYAEARYPSLFGWSPLSSLRRREVKYIAAPRPELYDLERDPGETANLAAAAGEADRLRGFAARLAEIEAGAVETPRGAVDAETRARLAALGYATGSPAPRSPSPGADPAASPDPKTMVALFQRYERAHNRLKAGETDSALAELEALVAADPANPVFRGDLAQAFRERGELDRALPLYRRAAEDAADNPDAWYDLASALQEAGRPGEAREALERALHLDPGRAEAHNTLALTLLAEGKLEDALRELELATALDPRDATALNNQGNVLRGLGRLDDAERAYRRAAEVAPRYAEPLNGLGTLEVDRDRPSAALPYFSQALDLAPAYHEVRLNRGIAYELAGETEAAVAAYREFLDVTGGDPRFAEQRRAAQQLLARLSPGATGAPGRR